MLLNSIWFYLYSAFNNGRCHRAASQKNLVIILSIEMETFIPDEQARGDDGEEERPETTDSSC